MVVAIIDIGGGPGGGVGGPGGGFGGPGGGSGSPRGGGKGEGPYKATKSSSEGTV